MRYGEETTKAESSSYAGITRIRFKGPERALPLCISAGLASSAPVFDCLPTRPPVRRAERGLRFVLILSHPAQLCQDLFEFPGVGALQGHPLPGAGVEKGEGPCVKPLSRQAGVGLAIHRVPQ